MPTPQPEVRLSPEVVQCLHNVFGLLESIGREAREKREAALRGVSTQADAPTPAADDNLCEAAKKADDARPKQPTEGEE